MTNQALAKLYKIPKNAKGAETTGKDYLQELYEKTGDPVFDYLVRIRSLQTNINNYIPNWRPGPDGRVHPTFSFAPPQGQLACRNPNGQNVSKHTEYGQEFRKIIEAPKGFVFVEFDYDRFHIATMGYLANDASYIRFGVLDCHSIFTAQVLGNPIDFLNLPDDEVVKECKERRKDSTFDDERNKKFKHIVLGNQLGLGARKLHLMHRKHIRSVREAESHQKTLAGMFPFVERFKEWIRREAYVKTFLINDWGRIQHFFDVYHYKWNKKINNWQQYHGTDSERALAFPVQSTAFGMMYWQLRELHKRGYLDQYNFIDTIHDSFIFMPPEDKLEECINTVYPILARPCTVLKKECCPEGLQVGVGVSVGYNWQKYHPEKNPKGVKEL